jgi:hypothetical protein
MSTPGSTSATVVTLSESLARHLVWLKLKPWLAAFGVVVASRRYVESETAQWVRLGTALVSRPVILDDYRLAGFDGSPVIHNFCS